MHYIYIYISLVSFIETFQFYKIVSSGNAENLTLKVLFDMPPQKTID